MYTYTYIFIYIYFFFYITSRSSVLSLSFLYLIHTHARTCSLIRSRAFSFLVSQQKINPKGKKDACKFHALRISCSRFSRLHTLPRFPLFLLVRGESGGKPKEKEKSKALIEPKPETVAEASSLIHRQMRLYARARSLQCAAAGPLLLNRLNLKTDPSLLRSSVFINPLILIDLPPLTSTSQPNNRTRRHAGNLDPWVQRSVRTRRIRRAAGANCTVDARKDNLTHSKNARFRFVERRLQNFGTTRARTSTVLRAVCAVA